MTRNTTSTAIAYTAAFRNGTSNNGTPHLHGGHVKYTKRPNKSVAADCLALKNKNVRASHKIGTANPEIAPIHTATVSL